MVFSLPNPDDRQTHIHTDPRRAHEIGERSKQKENPRGKKE
jgi:hypothetical protein